MWLEINEAFVLRAEISLRSFDREVLPVIVGRQRQRSRRNADVRRTLSRCWRPQEFCLLRLKNRKTIQTILTIVYLFYD